MIPSWIFPVVLIGGTAVVLFMAYRAGRKSERADAQGDTLKQINDALRPPTDDELGRVRDKYKRD